MAECQLLHWKKSTESVLRSPKYRTLLEIGQAESNSGVRILIKGSCVVVYAHSGDVMVDNITF